MPAVAPVQGAEQQKYKKKREGPKESALSRDRGRTRTSRRPGGSRPDGHGARGLEPRRAGGRVRRPARSREGGQRLAHCFAEPRRAGAGGRQPARWPAPACAEPGGWPAAGVVAVWAAGAWRPVGSGPVVACGSGATAGWRPQLADCFSRAAAVSRAYLQPPRSWIRREPRYWISATPGTAREAASIHLGRVHRDIVGLGLTIAVGCRECLIRKDHGKTLKSKQATGDRTVRTQKRLAEPLLPATASLVKAPFNRHSLKNWAPPPATAISRRPRSTPVLVTAECDCSDDAAAGRDKAGALRLKVVAIFCILAGGAVGAAVPSLGHSKFPALRPDTDLFLAVKAFAGGVILATGLVHILPAAFDALDSPCLVATGAGPWNRFPFTGMVAMLVAIATLMEDTVATGYFRRTVARKAAAAVGDEPPELGRCDGDPEPEASDSGGHHGHVHGMSVLAPAPTTVDDELVRHRVISQAKFRLRSMVAMALFFSLTTPIGITISSAYDETRPTALVVQGFLEAAAAGILVYLALVDILADDFMSARVQSRARLQVALNTSLLLGAGLMSMLAIWA
ncbi:zinc transporter 4-like [Miscanthus floridulus]|uniref:zinc transporter 4-like n=1 Tax=Miscanthus floridulus TaxID=154761 RepID=UPI00345A34AD